MNYKSFLFESLLSVQQLNKTVQQQQMTIQKLQGQ
jgi:hypothetical protein